MNSVTPSGFTRNALHDLKKENHLDTISKMMGTLVQVQLYTFSYRKALFRPQIMPKIADWGVKTAQIAKSKNMLGPKRQNFQNPTDKISSEQLRKVEKIKPFSHSRASKKIKKRTRNRRFPRPAETDPYAFSYWGNPHICAQCNKSFTQTGKLKEHIFSDSDEKPHS